MIGAISGKVSADTGAVQRAVSAIRNLIMRRELVPAQPVRQEDLARQIGISRGPIREALQILQADGVVGYERNKGYVVAQFSADEMAQLYLARDLLESAVLIGLDRPSDEALDELRTINAKIRAADADVETTIRENDRFHAAILALSNQKVLVTEIGHIWSMSIAYRAFSISMLSNFDRIAEDHDEMIAALEAGDSELLCELGRQHRQVSLNRLRPVLR